MLTPKSKKPPKGLIFKWNTLVENLASLERVAVAFSGGLDSSLLLVAAVFTLGTHNVRAFTCTGPLTPPWEVKLARANARAVGAEQVEVDARELEHPLVAENGPMRCYYCKRMRLELMASLAGGWAVAEGGHAGDNPATRPGMKAVEELGVASPLRHAGLTKSEIARLARWLGIGWAVRPSGACLATRIPTGTPLSLEALERVARAEEAVRELVGERVQVRVRDHWPVARVELGRGSWRVLGRAKVRTQVLRALKAAGYRRVCVDLGGYEEGGAS